MIGAAKVGVCECASRPRFAPVIRTMVCELMLVKARWLVQWIKHSNSRSRKLVYERVRLHVHAIEL